MINLQDLMSFYKWNSTHVDMKKCEELKNEGLLNIKKHILHPIYLLNYTAKTQYLHQWCKELIHARGLVVAADGEILARPLPKFFNHYEIDGFEDLHDRDYELYKKLDGSLAILFHYNGIPIFCTRGSFCSDQALKAEKIYKLKYEDVDVMKECTYCFEVIYPENRIVVDYDTLEGLFLISITHTKSGKEVNIDQTGFQSVKKFETNEVLFNEWLSHDVYNEEGYVMKIDSLRVKIKFSNYIHKHKIKNLSEEQIRKCFKRKGYVNLEDIPDEGYDEVRSVIAKLENQFKSIENECLREYEDILEKSSTPRDVIDAIKGSKHASILFCIHAKKPYNTLILKML